MRLITHNMLKSNIKGVVSGYPLQIESDKVEVEECPFDVEATNAMLSRINFSALKAAANALNITSISDLEELPDQDCRDETLLRTLHHILFEVHVIEGYLICPETGRKFPIHDGIPNMLLHEDEV
mmetsp:Transcript_24695/g.36400  ORF Transcript_24695/g.36400 Transcript_24695/m.36400 type:complete len:125 (-) Transcript_24695:148-522(-)|eukprot:CAMPEP_0185018644 /NCGR_PEP_ID=MMETSP1103-20130426/1303_1 /TAXON_ID=36769 /ORGANISM="Paraphysomonas bandaiensis, Strain Caron Lab Isolate" /LENGTH=124 /DNA_ID=CAMNT_0027548523 /DNA_START=33 /DNA_END=407 /DNA_ORIENTATION=-